jgi:hypothetical protein
MFDPGILHLVEGTNIDRPYNAFTLSVGLHRRFGNLEVYFEAVPDTEYTYTIKSAPPFQLFRPRLPITRDLFITPHHNIEPPMPRLLAIHRACCLILHMSGAAGYIDKVLHDMDESTVRSDGTTELGSLTYQLKILKHRTSKPHCISIDFGIRRSAGNTPLTTHVALRELCLVA